MGSIDLKKDQKKIIVMAALLAVLGIFVSFNFILKPQVGRVMAVTARAVKAKAQFRDAEAAIARMDALRKDIASYNERIGRYEKMLPTEQGIPGLLESLSHMAKTADMSIIGIMPLEPKADAARRGQAYQEIPIQISARAGYHELGRFLESLESADRFMKVADIRVTANRSTPRRHDVDLMVLTYTLAEGRFAPISTTLFGGLLVSTLLTLLVIPAIYSFIDDAGGWHKKKLRRQEPA